MGFVVGLAALIFVVFMLNAMLAGNGWHFWKEDATDQRDENGKVTKRSGLKIVTDYGTGVQYVYMPLAGMTPRLSLSGQHMVDPEWKPQKSYTDKPEGQ